MFLVRLCCALLVIRFDGSLRIPRDPIPGFATAGLGKVASCGSAILLDDDQTVVALGGRSIPLVPNLTSGDVEYDGLNLGLEWAVQAAARGDFDELWSEASGDVAAPAITIRGDCRTVIDHLNEVASPRKLRPKYEIAKKCMNRLREYALRRFGDVEVRFEHVLRDENMLCDALCGCAADLKQCETARAALEAIQLGVESSTNPTTRLELPSSTKKRYKFSKTHFGRALVVIPGSNVPYSSRFGLYCELARAANRSKDAVALRRLGEVLETDSKQWPHTNAGPGLGAGSMPTNKKDLEMLGILLNIRGLRLLGLNKEADKAECKHKVPVHDDEFDVVSAFLGDTDALVGAETMRAHLFPSTEIYKDETWSVLLNDWYHVARERVQSRVEGSMIENGVWRCFLDEIVE